MMFRTNIRTFVVATAAVLFALGGVASPVAAAPSDGFVTDPDNMLCNGGFPGPKTAPGGTHFPDSFFDGKANFPDSFFDGKANFPDSLFDGKANFPDSFFDGCGDGDQVYDGPVVDPYN